MTEARLGARLRPGAITKASGAGTACEVNGRCEVNGVGFSWDFSMVFPVALSYRYGFAIRQRVFLLCRSLIHLYMS